MFTDGLIANTRKQHRSSTAGSLGENISSFGMANCKSNNTIYLWTPNTTVKQYSRITNVGIVIGVTSNASPIYLSSSNKNAGAL